MEFRILGPVEVWDGGRRLDVGGPKPRTVLAALLLHADQTVSADRLIDELWGETPPATARNVLQCHVARLRRALHRPAEADGPTPVLLTRPGGYLLRIEPGQLDLHRFQEATERGRRAMTAGDAGEAAEQLRRALALWRGPALADVASESLRRTTAAPLEEARLVALEERLDADLALGRHTELVGELEALVAANPDRERPRRQLMLALYRSGRPAEALEAYRSARSRLAEEFGLEPSRPCSSSSGPCSSPTRPWRRRPWLPPGTSRGRRHRPGPANFRPTSMTSPGGRPTWPSSSPCWPATGRRRSSSRRSPARPGSARPPSPSGWRTGCGHGSPTASCT